MATSNFPVVVIAKGIPQEISKLAQEPFGLDEFAARVSAKLNPVEKTEDRPSPTQG